jgi:uncharacterized protein YggE
VIILAILCFAHLTQSPITNHQSSITNHQSLIINHQSSIINQLSTMNYLFCCGLATIIGLTPLTKAIAQEQIIPALTVTGEGSQTIPSTIIVVNLGIEIQGQEAVNVQQQVAQRTTAVVDFLKKRQVEKLQTTGFNLQPQYQYKDNARILLGYIGVNTVSFQLPVDKIGNLLDEAVKIGATRIDSITFTATTEAIANAEKEALRKATQDAQQQAEVVLKALNLTPSNIIEININRSNYIQPRFAQAQVMEATNGTPIIGGEQNIRANVTLKISFK